MEHQQLYHRFYVTSLCRAPNGKWWRREINFESSLNDDQVNPDWEKNILPAMRTLIKNANIIAPSRVERVMDSLQDSYSDEFVDNTLDKYSFFYASSNKVLMDLFEIVYKTPNVSYHHVFNDSTNMRGPSFMRMRLFNGGAVNVLRSMLWCTGYLPAMLQENQWFFNRVAKLLGYGNGNAVWRQVRKVIKAVPILPVLKKKWKNDEMSYLLQSPLGQKLSTITLSMVQQLIEHLKGKWTDDISTIVNSIRIMTVYETMKDIKEGRGSGDIWRTHENLVDDTIVIQHIFMRKLMDANILPTTYANTFPT